MSASTAAMCTTIIITLEPCALNAKFQPLRIPLKEGIGDESRPKDRVTLRISLISRQYITSILHKRFFYVAQLS